MTGVEKELKEQVLKHQEKMREVFRKIELVERGKSFEKLLKLAHAYFSDSKYFMMNKKPLQAFEALMISWAYIDAGLRLGLFEVPEELKKYFTIQ